MLVGGAGGRQAVPGSYEDFGERVGPGAGDVALGRVERNIVDGLVELLAVRRELLDARLVLQVPQPDGAVVACKSQDRNYIRYSSKALKPYIQTLGWIKISVAKAFSYIYIYI